MSKKAFLFPGQGSQFVGMAKDLYLNIEEIRELYHRANHVLGFDLAKVSFEGPEEALKQTRVTQPAIFVHSVAISTLLQKKGITPQMMAGHSLGEYSAFYTAGAFSFEDGLNLVKTRAELMQTAGEQHPGTMAAIIGLDPEAVQNVCEEARAAGVVQIANINSPGQLVISGDVDSVKMAMEVARTKGARKILPLVVSGAFHSPLMASAQEGLQKVLAETTISEVTVPVYTNVTARPVTKPEEIRRLLNQQLTSPVRWVEIIENMVRDGATEFYELGPGRVLTGLLKRINREVSGKAVGTLNDLEMV